MYRAYNRRKHRKQMRPEELANLRKELDALIDDLKFIPYAIKRMEERRITIDEVLSSVRLGEIIEAHNIIPDDIRVLVRHAVKDTTYSVCPVVSLKNKIVVTVYVNETKDNHETLDWSLYNWKVDLSGDIWSKIYAFGRN